MVNESGLLHAPSTSVVAEAWADTENTDYQTDNKSGGVTPAERVRSGDTCN